MNTVSAAVPALADLWNREPVSSLSQALHEEIDNPWS